MTGNEQTMQGMLERMHQVNEAPLNESSQRWDGEIEIETARGHSWTYRATGGSDSATFSFRRADDGEGIVFNVRPHGPSPVGDFSGESIGYIDNETAGTAEEAFNIAERHGRVAGWKIAGQTQGTQLNEQQAAEHSDSRAQAYIDGHTVGVHGLDANCMWIQGSDEEKIWEMGTAHGTAQMFSKTPEERLKAARSSGKAAREIGVPASANPHKAARKNPEHRALADAWAGTMNEGADPEILDKAPDTSSAIYDILDDPANENSHKALEIKKLLEQLERHSSVVRSNIGNMVNFRRTYKSNSREISNIIVEVGEDLAVQCRKFLKVWEGDNYPGP